MIDFNKLIENYLHRENRPKSIGRYYPSEIGSCLRKVWYSYKYPQETEPDLIKIFHVGNILHEFVAEVLKSGKSPDIELVKSELPFKMELEGFTISGRIDNLLLIRESGKMFLVEVKSTKSIKSIDTPQPQHEMQLQLYMHSMGIDNGAVLYVQKDNLQSKSFAVDYNKNKAEEALERFKQLDNHLKSNKIPSPEAKKVEDMNWMCSYCEYKERCDGSEKSG